MYTQNRTNYTGAQSNLTLPVQIIGFFGMIFIRIRIIWFWGKIIRIRMISKNCTNSYDFQNHFENSEEFPYEIIGFETHADALRLVRVSYIV